MLSRVADSLYWMSRYLERAEHTARQLEVHLNLALDQEPVTVEKRRLRVLDALDAASPETEAPSDYQLFNLLSFERENANSITACVGVARDNARQVRELISTEMWQQLNQLHLFMQHANPAQIWAEEPYSFLQTVKQGCHLFEGITDSTMSHGQGWIFIQLGRYLERSVAIANLLDQEYPALVYGLEPALAADSYLNALGLLKGCTAFEAYGKVYSANLLPRNIAEFLLLNPEFPHAIRFAVDRIQDGLAQLADMTGTQRGARVYRLAGRLRAALDYGQIDEIIVDGLNVYLNDVRSQCFQMHDAIYHMYISYPIEEKLLL